MTPGPWRIVADPMHFDSLTTVEAGNMVAQVGGLKSNLKEMEANTRLIAAAPDLLEALQGILYHFVPERGNLKVEDDMIKKAHAAIAKARGEPK